MHRIIYTLHGNEDTIFPRQIVLRKSVKGVENFTTGKIAKKQIHR